ncbi:hypothetical protein [Streptomyces sp. UG1]|uniref:hypothetical protein n=1 Tax=Streptomyces sp. UG1 TaxID=3417652 RepID=UPI003CEDCE50
MLPIGSLENVLLTIAPYGGTDRARHNAAQAAAAASAERRENEAAGALLAQHDLAHRT